MYYRNTDKETPIIFWMIWLIIKLHRQWYLKQYLERWVGVYESDDQMKAFQYRRSISKDMEGNRLV